MSWWRPADRQVARWQRELREARAAVSRVNGVQAETLRQLEATEAARDQARAQLDVVQRVERQHTDKLRAIARVLADESITTAAANQRVRQILMEAGPVSGGGDQ